MDARPNDFWNGSPKNMFFMGLFLGLAAASMVALVITLSLLWSGKSLAAAPSPTPTPTAPSPTPTPDPSNPSQPPAQPVKAVGSGDHVEGAKNAKVTLIEYSDFECPFCKRHEPTLAQVLKDFPNDVRLVYRHYPLTTLHPHAQKAAEASECAYKQGGDAAFWKWHDQILASTQDYSEDLFVSIAKGIGLNGDKFKACVDSGEMAARVAQDVASGNDSGVQGTPATFVNGQLISGAVPYADFKTAVQQAGAKN